MNDMPTQIPVTALLDALRLCHVCFCVMAFGSFKLFFFVVFL